MKIVYLSASSVPSRTANSIQVMKMCEAFSAAGHRVTLVAGRGTDLVQDTLDFYGIYHGFQIVTFSLPAMKGRSVAHALLSYRYLRQRKDIDLAYGRSPYALWFAAFLGIPSILEVHAPPANAFQERIVQSLIGRRSFTRVVAISKTLADHYQARFPRLSTEQIVVAHDAASMPEGLTPALSSWPGRPEALQAGYVGHLYPGKGMEVVVRLAPMLPDVDFHIVGGTEADIAFWRSRANGPNIHWHGFVPPQRVPQVLSHLDVTLAPYQEQVSVHGGKSDVARWMSPLKIFEYMAAGKAIVASDLPVLREVLCHGNNSLLVSPKDVAAWAQAVRTLRDDPHLRQMLAANAQADFEARHTWAQRVKAVLEQP